MLAGEAFVLKLYKRSDGVMQYWEAWSAGDKVIIHSGTIGGRGEIRRVGWGRKKSSTDDHGRGQAAAKESGY